MTIIDSHQHFWQLGRFGYGWLTPANPVLYRDYLPEELLPDMAKAGVERTVLVQADGSVAETRWMLELADQYPSIAGVVGWIDLAAPDAPATLAELARHPRFKGIRPDLSGEAPTLQAGLTACAELGIACDVLVGGDQLPHVVALAREHPGVAFVLDHFACMALSPGGHAQWANQVRAAAQAPNIVLKVSGYLTAARPRPLTAGVLRSYVEAALDAFGSARMMYGSDWPVCLQAGSYGEAVAALREATSTLSTKEQANLWGNTAARTYKLGEIAGDPGARIQAGR